MLLQFSVCKLLMLKKYACEVLKKFNMMNCNSARIPAILNLKLARKIVDATLFNQIVGSLR